MTVPTLRENYRSQQAAKAVKSAYALTAKDVLAAHGPLPNEKDTRDGAMRVAECMQRARPHKIMVVFNIFGHRRWFVRSFDEGELRKFLSESKQTKPITRKRQNALMPKLQS